MFWRVVADCSSPRLNAAAAEVGLNFWKQASVSSAALESRMIRKNRTVSTHAFGGTCQRY
jgi:hypothetical protein